MIRLLSIVIVLISIQSAVLVGTSAFYLYTQLNPDASQILITGDVNSVTLSYFNVSHPVVIYIPDNNEFDSSPSALKDAYLAKDVSNFIIVDWSYETDNDLKRAAKYPGSVGLATSTMIRFLRYIYEEPLDITIVGFGLGAHAAGLAGRRVTPKVDVIVGLDPTHQIGHQGSTLQPTDATYVQVIHTTKHGRALKKPLGTGNFYVHYGNPQPGCLLIKCSHSRAFEYFEESIGSSYGFWGTPCEDEQQLRWGKCLDSGSTKKEMGGYPVDSYATGLFNVEVNKYPPYAKG